MQFATIQTKDMGSRMSNMSKVEIFKGISMVVLIGYLNFKSDGRLAFVSIQVDKRYGDSNKEQLCTIVCMD